jgi:putative nucleotidyltransferase with HDIG domain
MTLIDDLRLDPQVKRLLAEVTAFLGARGIEAYATGGFIRDALLGTEIHDLDISIRADPVELAPKLADLFGGDWFAIDRERPLVRVLIPDHDLHFDFAPLNGSIEDDLRGRDFTIDAMAAPLKEVATGSLYLIDPTGGQKDLEDRTVRLVSEEALVNDPLRLLRGVRLAAQLRFEIEPDTYDALRRQAGLLDGSSVVEGPSPQPLGAGALNHKGRPSHGGNVTPVAAERQRDELMQMLRTDHGAHALRLLDELTLLDRLLPEAAIMRGAEQPKEHFWDVLGHAFAAVEALDWLLAEGEPLEEPQRSLWGELWGQLDWWEEGRGYFREQFVTNTYRCALIKLAAFLHDVGKPETKTFEESGRMRFFGHHVAGADIAVRALKRLRFSSREVDYVRTVVRAHMRPLLLWQQGEPTRKALYRYFRDTGEAGIDTLFHSLADHVATSGPRITLEEWRPHVAVVSYMLRKRAAEPDIISPPKLVSGDDLMAEFDLPAGELLGDLLDAIRDAQGAGEVTTREEAMALARERLEGMAPTPSPGSN